MKWRAEDGGGEDAGLRGVERKWKERFLIDLNKKGLDKEWGRRLTERLWGTVFSRSSLPGAHLGIAGPLTAIEPAPPHSVANHHLKA